MIPLKTKKPNAPPLHRRGEEAGTPITQDVGRNRDRRQHGAAPVAYLYVLNTLMEGHWRLEIGVPREILLRRFPSAGNDPIVPQSTRVSGLGTALRFAEAFAEVR